MEPPSADLFSPIASESGGAGANSPFFSFCSDGTTPEEQTKQILNVTAILPGQTVDRRFSIPERKCDPALQNQTDDLIDFGQSDEPAKRPQPGSVERKDSDTNSIDEFVDAES